MTNLELLKNLDPERLTKFLLDIIGFNSEEERNDFKNWLNAPTSPKFFVNSTKSDNVSDNRVDESKQQDIQYKKLIDKIHSQKEEILNLKRILNKILTE